MRCARGAVSSTMWPMRCSLHRPGRVRLPLIVLALGLGGQMSPGLRAQQHPSTITAGLETIQIRPNVYVIFGAGANVTVHVGEDGLVLVDSGSGDRADELLNALRLISPRPIRLIINTSADADHVGGNAVIGSAGVPVSPDPFARETPRDRARPRERAAANERANRKPVAFSPNDVANRDVHLAISADVHQ